MRGHVLRLLDWAFWLWALVGVGVGFSLSSLGIFTLPVSAIVGLILARHARFRSSGFGLLVGIGAVLVLIAYVNREGPGTVCHTFPNGSECAHGLPDPRKWLAVGLLFIAAGVIGGTWRTAR